MATRSSAPLSQNDYNNINTSLRDLETTLRDIERAKLAGVECSQEDAFCRDLKGRLEQIKTVYFPDQP
jgi:sugar phosphate isomerase/epimerase